MKNSALRTVIGGLAATRLVRAWKFEQIGEAPSAKIIAWLDEPVTRGTRVIMRPTMLKQWVKDLLECPHCLGFWLTVMCVVALRHRPARWFIEGLAGSMILSTIVQWYPGFSYEEPEPKTIRVEQA